MVVGGIAEMFMVSKSAETVYLKKRKKFTRIAVEVRKVSAFRLRLDCHPAVHVCGESFLVPIVINTKI